VCWVRIRNEKKKFEEIKKKNFVKLWVGFAWWLAISIVEKSLTKKKLYIIYF
jgi:hypothetical protein